MAPIGEVAVPSILCSSLYLILDLWLMAPIGEVAVPSILCSSLYLIFSFQIYDLWHPLEKSQFPAYFAVFTLFSDFRSMTYGTRWRSRSSQHTLLSLPYFLISDLWLMAPVGEVAVPSILCCLYLIFWFQIYDLWHALEKSQFPAYFALVFTLFSDFRSMTYGTRWRSRSSQHTLL